MTGWYLAITSGARPARAGIGGFYQGWSAWLRHWLCRGLNWRLHDSSVVRELLADLERSPVFERVRRHIAAGTGRRRVSGLTATARALYLPYFVRASD